MTENSKCNLTETNIFCVHCLPQDQNDSKWKLSTVERHGKRWLVIRCVKCNVIISHKLDMWTRLATAEVIKNEFWNKKINQELS